MLALIGIVFILKGEGEMGGGEEVRRMGERGGVKEERRMGEGRREGGKEERWGVKVVTVGGP